MRHLSLIIFKLLFMLQHFKIPAVLILSVLFSAGCKKNEEKPLSLVPPDANQLTLSSFSWNHNDDRYLASMKRFSKNYNVKSSSRQARPLYCAGARSTSYGYYDDPENFIVEGSYVAAATPADESAYMNCDSMLAIIREADIYLTSEGYWDIVKLYRTERYKLIHAANTLIDLKIQCGYISSVRTAQEAKFFNCVLQAIGYSAIADLGANWASMSRQAMIRAVGKLATKYLSWVGAAVAIVSFVDCITD
jgi:hypothetical protein